MNFVRVLFMSFAIFSVACVSAHKQNISKQTGQNKDPELIVSVEKNRRLSTKNFVVLEFTIENKGSDYKRFEDIVIAVDDKFKKEVKVIVGQDLASWSEGIKNKIELEDYNYRTFMAGLTAVAGTAAALSKDKDFATASYGVAVAGAGAISIDRFIEIRNNVKNTKKYDTRGLIPDNHILATPVSIPPNLFLKRFAVFHVGSKVGRDFYEMKIDLNAKDSKQSISLNAKFDKAPLGGGSGCRKIGPEMIFRKRSIRCVENCNELHPFNQKACIKAYQRKFPGQ